ncbi:MAG TPA: hypothetical protein VNG33_14230 [Polyangiaceae bacterium]|nr:hypothetical protein [Polyangiaceae bacterium]
MLGLFGSAEARAAPASVVVEIDGAAERVVDARSARRLVPLELADVAVPAEGGARGVPVLFFRVLGRTDGSLRIELWERGEYHGARTLSGAGENPQLVARRVALAAAELGRRLARKREATLAREQRLRLSREAREREQRERTQDGPVAWRAELAFARVPRRLWLGGERGSAELSLRGPLRLDVTGELWFGSLTPRLRAELEGVGLGPAYRLALTRQLDLDLSVQLAALLIQVPEARALDAVPNQDSSWTARVTGSARLQLRLARQLRLTFAPEAGGLLRSMSYVGPAGQPERLRGAWWGASLGVVFTPR